MAKKFICVLMVGLLVVSVSGCATLFKNKYASVSIDSDPQGADIYINGNRMGRTPMPIKLSHKKPVTITFKKEGYEDKTYIISNHVGAIWVVLDVLGGWIPIIVDAVTGDWYSLDDEEVKVLLEIREK